MKKTLGILLGCILMFIVSISIDKFIEKSKSVDSDVNEIIREKTNELLATKKIDIKIHDGDKLIKTITSDSEIKEIIQSISLDYDLAGMTNKPFQIKPLYYLEFYDNDNNIIDVLEIEIINDTDAIYFTFRSFSIYYNLYKKDGKSLIKLIEE